MKHTIVLIGLGVLLTPFTLFVSDCVARSSYGQNLDGLHRLSDARIGEVLVCQTASPDSEPDRGQICSRR